MTSENYFLKNSKHSELAKAFIDYRGSMQDFNVDMKHWEIVKKDDFWDEYCVHFAEKNKELIIDWATKQDIQLAYVKPNDLENVFNEFEKNKDSLTSYYGETILAVSESAVLMVRQDYETVMQERQTKAIQEIHLKNGYVLELAPDDLRADKEVVLAAVNSTGDVLEHASLALQNDREVVMAAVQNSGRALEFASHDLQNDKEIVMTAVKENPHALQWASNKLKSDKDVVLAAVNSDGETIRFSHLTDDAEVVMTALKTDRNAYFDASTELMSNSTIKALAKGEISFDEAIKEYKNNTDLNKTNVLNYERKSLIEEMHQQKNQDNFVQKNTQSTKKGRGI